MDRRGATCARGCQADHGLQHELLRAL